MSVTEKEWRSEMAQAHHAAQTTALIEEALRWKARAEEALAQRDRAWAALEKVQSFGGDSAFGYGLHSNFELAPDAELWPMAALAYAAGQQVAAVLAEARAEKGEGER